MAEFRFEQLDYPRMLYKDGEIKTVADAAGEASALKAGWKLKATADPEKPEVSKKKTDL